jgi:hypothetical protein
MTIYFHYNCPQEFSMVVLGFVSNCTNLPRPNKGRKILWIFLKFSSYATEIFHLLLSLTDYVIYSERETHESVPLNGIDRRSVRVKK